MSSEDWTVLESNTVVMDLVITDILILSKKERAPQFFTTLEYTADRKKADFPEGVLGHTRRYLCYTRKSPAPARGRVALAELKVIGSSERAPLGYAPLTYTHDDNTKAFSSKQLLAKFTPLEEVTQAVTDLVVLSPSKKEDVPAGYRRLPEINGFSICFKVTKLPEKGTNVSPPTTSAQQLRPQQQLQQPDSPLNRQPSVLVKRIRSAIDGVTFKLKDETDTQQYLVQFALGQLKLLSLEDVESEFDYDWSEWKEIAHRT